MLTKKKTISLISHFFVLSVVVVLGRHTQSKYFWSETYVVVVKRVIEFIIQIDCDVSVYILKY